MKWNYSQNYALAVGLLADRFNGITNGLENIDDSPNPFTNEHLKALQAELLALGYNIGTPDGVWGAKTRTALQNYQQKNHLIADGFPNESVFKKLNIALGKKP